MRYDWRLSVIFAKYLCCFIMVDARARRDGHDGVRVASKWVGLGWIGRINWQMKCIHLIGSGGGGTDRQTGRQDCSCGCGCGCGCNR